MSYVFVYGTLKKGHNENLLGKERVFIEEAVLNDYAMYHLGGFPGIVPEAGGTLKGEIWEIDENQIPRLDRYEGVPYLYQRESLEINGKTCYTYVYQGQPQVEGCNRIFEW